MRRTKTSARKFTLYRDSVCAKRLLFTVTVNAHYTVCMKKTWLLLIASLFSIQAFAEGKILRYQHHKNDAASYLSKVYEDIYIDGIYAHRSEITNWISSKVVLVSDDGNGRIQAKYMTSEKATGSKTGNISTWGEEFESEFTRTPTGHMIISKDLFMPTVRDVPVFPQEEVDVGSKWTAKGEEAEDLRATFNIEKPYIVPFNANYTYLRDEKDGERTLQVISCSYNFYYETPVKEVKDPYMPKVTRGKCEQIIYWDNDKGLLDHYTEYFSIQIKNFAGNTFLFEGNSEAEVTEFVPATTETLKRVQETVEELSLPDVSVTQNERGLTISLENIQFQADSAILMNSEKAKLQKIADILSEFPNDLLITGHCAERGTEENRQIISEARAETVAQYLEMLGVKDANHIFTMGMGSREPVASNATESGRKKNRRVEITILE